MQPVEVLVQLQDQAKCQTKILENLVAGSGSSQALDCYPGLTVTIHRMGEGDDPQAFLKIFQVLAEACRCPAKEWTLLLPPLLSWKAQTEVLSLPRGARGCFAYVWQCSYESHRPHTKKSSHRFRESQMGPDDQLFTFAKWLDDVAAQLLQADSTKG